MMRYIVFIAFSCILAGFPWSNSEAQEIVRRNVIPQDALTSRSIDSQYYFLNRMSRTQEGYKLIRPANLERFKANVSDSLRSTRLTIIKQRDSIEQLSNQIAVLEGNVKDTQSQLDLAEQKGKSISLLGIELNASLYHTIVWLVILLLVVALILISISVRRNNLLARDAKNNLADLQSTFDQHRKKSLEKEQKLMRQLQDEINKRNG